MDIKKIRNFSVIAHIDHGKSTLADRMLEVTNTVEKRKMKDQILDDMELERERGITIKMRPVRMKYSLDNEEYFLNLIDTPGHIDFSYEVSRALRAVEGSILLVDATQGVQAQTLTTLEMARKAGLVIIPVLSKVDAKHARIDEVKLELIELLNCEPDDIIETSGKTGQGVEDLLKTVIEKVPPPETQYEDLGNFRALVFDFQYSNHTGVIVYVRVLDGSLKRHDTCIFSASKNSFLTLETGTFNPQPQAKESIGAGEIGYIVTGIKQPGIASVGDTITLKNSKLPPFEGYMQPQPVVWASIFPESQDEFEILRTSLAKLRLSDSSFIFEPESSGDLGRGFRCGFLGMLHLEIITERLRREFSLELVVTLPSITYFVTKRNGETETIYSAPLFPDYGDVERVEEPWIEITLISPSEYTGALVQLLFSHEGILNSTESFGDGRNALYAEMPLRELMRNFFDEVKSVSSGYASFSYKHLGMREADVCKLELLVAEKPITAFTRVVSRARVEVEAEKAVEKLYKILPRQMFTTKIQAKALGRIISSKTLSALRKNVTAHLYGGDITRKMKLREKQKKGKKKMQEMGKVNIDHEIFLKMMKGGDEDFK